MNATMTTALRTIALVIIVLVAATAGLVVGQLMQGRDTRETAAAGGPLNSVRYWDMVAPQPSAPALTTIRYWDLMAPHEEQSRPQPGQRKASPSTEANVDPDSAVKRGLAPR